MEVERTTSKKQLMVVELLPGLLRKDAFSIGDRETHIERIDLSRHSTLSISRKSLGISKEFRDFITAHGAQVAELSDLKYAHAVEFVLFNGSNQDLDSKRNRGSGTRIGFSVYPHLVGTYQNYGEIFIEGEKDNLELRYLISNLTNLTRKIEALFT